MLTMKIKFIHPDAKTPAQGSAQAAGWDVYAVEDGKIPGGRCKRIPLGFAIELPDGWCARLKQRGSIFEKGILFNDSPFDADYRGEWFAIVSNTGTWPFLYKKGDRLGQILFEPVPIVRWVKVDTLSETERGAGGFGSTGK